MIAQEIMGSIANLPASKRNLRCYQLCKDGALRVYDTSWCFVTLLRALDFYSAHSIGPPSRYPTDKPTNRLAGPCFLPDLCPTPLLF